ncbi:beta-glucosidase BglX [Paenibacillus pinistramenti]|uniref:beta-glucosidase BglX n=1 Tax=Paenibacillus pinistramenti TaxID=1768003 RepID=UPI001109B189|nr:beta-glucosidase BglX [Paenibacillus pinistramenti]
MRSRLVTEYLNKMTLEEKTAQLLQLAVPFFKGAKDSGQITGPMKSLGITEAQVDNAGSVLGLAGAEEVLAVQQAHLENNRLGIPLLIMADIVHGFKTIFPVPLAIGCSWDLELARKSAEIAAREAAVSGVHVTFAPMVDLVRDPRWGRVMESTGEDPCLNSLFAKAFVQGFQGDDLRNETDRVAACVKHFAAYGLAEGGRDYNTVDLSELKLRESYLPGYKAALDAGAEMVMTSFNTLDGIPATGNRKLMRQLLREEWGFNGVLISDWGAVKELIPHGVAEDEREAALKALQAGVDIEMMTSCYVHYLPQLVAEGLIEEKLIDEAVLRILELKEKLGLFERPARGADPELERKLVYSSEHRAVSRELAAKSCVLLKNDGLLPLDRQQRVALIGPFADSGDILGPWSWTGSQETAARLGAAMQAASADAASVTIAAGCGIDTFEEALAQEAAAAAEAADVIVLALGEASEMSGEAGSRGDIRLPQAQLELLKRMKQLGKPLAVVLFNGRPLDLSGVLDEAGAVLEAWFPGSEGGLAIADLLYGAVNPSGKLTMSFPYSTGQIPVYYNHFNTGRPQGAPDAQIRYVSQYLDLPNEALLPFGYGLSYTTFAYGKPELSSNSLTSQQPLQVSVTVTNTGSMAGTETVQLYIRDMAGEVVRPLKELKAFQQVELAPGESREVSFEIDESMLRYHHSDLSFRSDPGAFKLFIGTSSRDVQEADFRLL